MDGPEIIFVPSAFKHHCVEEDIRQAYETRVFDGLIEGGLVKDSENKYCFVGFNRAGNPIEVFYNPIGENVIKVFHAMGLRNEVLKKIWN